ncbi:MAG: glycosyltransferase family 4 protein [Magnetococcales bacterium]|nr:glycosyltransferase family 4 protein [Magnetococcales bacterium]
MSLMPGRGSPAGGGWRISFICHEFPPFGGGAATALDALSRELVQRGHQVQIVTVGAGLGQAVEEDCLNRRQVVRLGGLRRSTLTPTTLELLFSYLTLRWRGFAPLAAFSPQAVVAFFAFPAGHALFSMGIPSDIPCAVWLRGSDVPGFFNSRWHWLQPLHPYLVRPVLAKADLLLANGDHLAHLANHFFPQRSPYAVANGIDPTHYYPAPVDETTVPYRILAVGQLIPRKGWQELLVAMEWISQQGKNLHLTLVGDGPMRHLLQQQAAAIAPPVTVHLAGYCPREEMATIYRNHHLLVHLSKAEGVSNVLLEALASGLPVITRAESVVESGLTSPAITLLPEITGPSVGEAILRMVENTPHWLDLSRHARKTALRYSWSLTASQLEALLKPLIQRH